MNIIKNEHGFLLLNVVFLTLITSFAAVILINAAPRARNPQSTLRLTALYLANEQIAQLESLAADSEEPSTSDLTEEADRKYNSTNENSNVEIEFKVTTERKKVNENMHEVTVKVSWSEKDFVEVKRRILVVH